MSVPEHRFLVCFANCDPLLIGHSGVFHCYRLDESSLAVSDLFCRFYSILLAKNVDPDDHFMCFQVRMV